MLNYIIKNDCRNAAQDWRIVVVLIFCCLVLLVSGYHWYSNFHSSSKHQKITIGCPDSGLVAFPAHPDQSMRECTQLISTTFLFQPVPVNLASPELLMTLPGIGPGMAQRIISYRTTNGLIADKRDLLNIQGIGEKTYAAIAGQISFVR